MLHLELNPISHMDTMSPSTSDSGPGEVSADFMAETVSRSSSKSSSVVDVQIKETSLETTLKAQNRNLRRELAETQAKLDKLEAKQLRRDALKKHTFYEEPFVISFPEDEDVYLASKDKQHGEVPEYFYRAHYETSGTLSCYVTKDCWPSVHPKYKKGAAFQSLNEFLPVRDLTFERVMRHFIWQQKNPTTSFISVFDNYLMAEQRAKFLYHDSARHPRRISVVRMSNRDLTPAFFVTTEILPAGPVEAAKSKRLVNKTPEVVTTQESLATCSPSPTSVNTDEDAGSTPEKAQENTIVPKKTRKVKIPIYVRKSAVPEDRSDITIQQFEDSGSDIWLSVRENQKSGLNLLLVGGRGQPEEWLAGGVIPKEYVDHVWPFDGTKVHTHDGDKVVTSSAEVDYEFGTKDRIWRSKTEKRKLEQEFKRNEIEKRKSADVDSASSKRQKPNPES